VISKCIKIISRGHSKLTVGQGSELIAINSGEILSVAEILEVFENKTAAAFRVSLLLGATIGGADRETLESLDRFSRFIGIAYQLKDDLADYQGNKGDIENRRFSVLLSMLKEKLKTSDQDLLSKALMSGQNSVIYELIDHYDIQKETESLLTGYLNGAKSCLENFRNMGLKLALYEILGKIFKDYI
jgi:geranylgeranyl diphosphate synthase type II